MKNILLLCVGLTLSAATMPAQTPEDVFNGGNEAYRAGKFREAVTEYESILRQGIASPEIYFNLGNAYYRQGTIAHAILAYERARRLAPGDPDIEHNLKLANLRIVDRIEPVPELFLITWIRTLMNFVSLPVTARIVLFAWIVLFVSLGLLYGTRKPFAVRIARWSVPGSLLVVLLFGALLTFQALEYGDRSEAIVLSPVLTAKNSPDEQSVDAFVIHQGLKVTLSDEVGEWVKVALADGKVGWIHLKDCERI